MKIDLSGMNVLVTGASRGIGREIALQLSHAGAAVGVHYHKNKTKAQELLGMMPGEAQMFQADLSCADACLNLMEKAVGTFGQIHCLVNNAGIFLESPIDGKSKGWLANWQQTLQVNLTATGILCRSAINHFSQFKVGRIINISSRAAFRGDDPDYLAYAASKGGMVSLTRSIARGFGKKGIKAFLIAPGFVETDMAEDFFKIHGREGVLEGLALPELTQPQHVASFVVFLSSGLGDHATGCTIDINAGSYVH